MGFELFDRATADGDEASSVPAVTISGDGEFHLNSAAKRLLDQLRPGCHLVELLYDLSTRRVAIRPVNGVQEASTRFPVRVQRGRGSAVVDAREFVRYWCMLAGAATHTVVVENGQLVQGRERGWTQARRVRRLCRTPSGAPCRSRSLDGDRLCDQDAGCHPSSP